MSINAGAAVRRTCSNLFFFTRSFAQQHKNICNSLQQTLNIEMCQIKFQRSHNSFQHILQQQHQPQKRRTQLANLQNSGYPSLERAEGETYNMAGVPSLLKEELRAKNLQDLIHLCAGKWCVDHTTSCMHTKPNLFAVP
jgi:hypothetical protein